MSDELVSDDYAQILLSSVGLLDVRAPIEFAKGAFPDATNIALLGDEARHLVGIEYKEAGQKSAIALGAKLLPESARVELVDRWRAFAETNPQGYLYCFRGGLRSHITQEWLRDAGCDYPLIKGGYKALRQFLITRLQERCDELSFCLISGRTGTGKTRVLNNMPSSIDLEGLAKHRGSSFGRMAVEQPSNIDFEHAITMGLMRLPDESGRFVYLEDESRMIGSVCVPETLREQTQHAPVAVLETPLEVRVRIGVEDYVLDLLQRYQQRDGESEGFIAFADYHRASLQRVQKRFGGERYKQALELLNIAISTHQSKGDTVDYDVFIEMILTDYYDPMYDYQMKAKQDRVVFTGDADSLLSWSASHAVSA